MGLGLGRWAPGLGVGVGWGYGVVGWGWDEELEALPRLHCFSFLFWQRLPQAPRGGAQLGAGKGDGSQGHPPRQDRHCPVGALLWYLDVLGSP